MQSLPDRVKWVRLEILTPSGNFKTLSQSFKSLSLEKLADFKPDERSTLDYNSSRDSSS